jgi:hypothetical protein
MLYLARIGCWTRFECPGCSSNNESWYLEWAHGNLLSVVLGFGAFKLNVVHIYPKLTKKTSFLMSPTASLCSN